MLSCESIYPTTLPLRTRLRLHASIDSSASFPRIRFSDVSNVETQIILFSPPNPHEMQFFSLTPITLDLAASDLANGRPRADSMVVDERDQSETARMDVLVQKMGQHFPRREGQPTQGADLLQAAISQVCF